MMKKITILIGILFAFFVSQAQITADFTWNDPQCSGGTITFTDASTGDPASDWSWEINGSEVSLGSSTFIYTFPSVSAPTDFSVKLIVSAGFESDDITYTVTIYPLPAVNIPDVEPVCEGSTATLTEDGGDGVSWSWSTGETDQTITPTVTENTEFTVEVTDGNGCANSDTVTVAVNPLPTPDLGEDQVVCASELPVILNVGSYTAYAWSTGETTPTLAVENTGQYSVQVTDEHGCANSDTVTVAVNPLPTPDLGEDQVVCASEAPVVLDAGTYTTYAWSTGETTPTLAVENTGQYSVQVTDGNGCSNSDTVNVIVNPDYYYTTDTAMCAGDSIQWHGEWYNQAGTYSLEYTSVTGCDSIYTLNLTENPLPILITVLQNPVDGLLEPGTTGKISLPTSYVDTKYWSTKGTAMFSGDIQGTGAGLSLGTNYIPGSYEVWSETDAGCLLKQGTVTFVENSGTPKIIGTPTYGKDFSSFADGAIELTLYRSTTDINGNPVIIVESGPATTANGNVVFGNLIAGDYYLKSNLLDTATYNNIVPVYFFDGPTVDSADVISIADLEIRSVNINHPAYPDTTGTNTAGGNVDTISDGKSTGIADQIVILRNEITGEILSASITDAEGHYFIDKVPDNANVQLYVTSFEHQNWTAAGFLTETNTNYTVNFIVDGNSVYPEGAGINKLINNLEFELYPNPAQDLIYLKNVPAGSTLKIFDNMGKLVVQDIRYSKSNLDVSYLSKGIYLVVVTTKNGQSGVQKLIKE